MRGDEARVVDAFCRYLEDHGWALLREVDQCDVVASKADRTLYAEAKGRTSSPGLDVDTLYGQLLRRMPEEPQDTDSFAVVVPTRALTAALRVPAAVRRRLGIHVYEVTDDDAVRYAGPDDLNPVTS